MTAPAVARERVITLLAVMGGALALVLGALAILAFVPAEDRLVVWPVATAAVIFAAFTALLAHRVKGGVFGELGFMYLLLVMVYTVLPAYAFISFDYSLPLILSGLNILNLPTEPAQLGAHFWRHTLFLTGVAVSYLWARGTVRAPTVERTTEPADPAVVLLWLAVIVACIGILTVLSAPVTNYYEHYTRYEHLGGLPLLVVWGATAVKNGGYIVVMCYLFRDYRRHRALLFLFVPAVLVYEAYYSFGSRIQGLTVLLAAGAAYHFMVREIHLRRAAIYLLSVGVMFSAVEVFRSSGYDLESAQGMVAQDGGGAVAEFGAVFITSYHLYFEREQHTLPPRPPAMLVNDIIAVIPGLDHTGAHPQYWYARNYFPNALVPPATIGLIAESALWGGEWDLLIRSMLNGALFAWVMRWFLRRRDRWIPFNVFVYVFATCVMTLKYSLLYHLQPLLRTLAPALVVHFALQQAVAVYRELRRRAGAGRAAPA